MQILRSGKVESYEQLVSLAKEHKRPGALIYIAKDVEFITFWAFVLKDGQEIMYTGTEETFGKWITEEQGVQ